MIKKCSNKNVYKMSIKQKKRKVSLKTREGIQVFLKKRKTKSSNTVENNVKIS